MPGRGALSAAGGGSSLFWATAIGGAASSDGRRPARSTGATGLTAAQGDHLTWRRRQWATTDAIADGGCRTESGARSPGGRRRLHDLHGGDRRAGGGGQGDDRAGGGGGVRLRASRHRAALPRGRGAGAGRRARGDRPALGGGAGAAADAGGLWRATTCARRGPGRRRRRWRRCRRCGRRCSTFQKRFARRDGGAVLDGRDIGTVICPEAEAKLFVTASDEVRAERRRAELGAREPRAGAGRSAGARRARCGARRGADDGGGGCALARHHGFVYRRGRRRGRRLREEPIRRAGPEPRARASPFRGGRREKTGGSNRPAGNIEIWRTGCQLRQRWMISRRC